MSETWTWKNDTLENEDDEAILVGYEDAVWPRNGRDAALIASAPKLLAQCEYARSFLEGLDSPGARRLTETIGAAIAKAEGKPS
jgi:hypothetical protein